MTKYEQIALSELRVLGLGGAVWTKALTEEGGDEEAARITYVRLRAGELASKGDNALAFCHKALGSYQPPDPSLGIRLAGLNRFINPDPRYEYRKAPDTISELLGKFQPNGCTTPEVVSYTEGVKEFLKIRDNNILYWILNESPYTKSSFADIAVKEVLRFEYKFWWAPGNDNDGKISWWWHVDHDTYFHDRTPEWLREQYRHLSANPVMAPELQAHGIKISAKGILYSQRSYAHDQGPEARQVVLYSLFLGALHHNRGILLMTENEFVLFSRQRTNPVSGK